MQDDLENKAVVEPKPSQIKGFIHHVVCHATFQLPLFVFSAERNRNERSKKQKESDEYTWVIFFFAKMVIIIIIIIIRGT